MTAFRLEHLECSQVKCHLFLWLLLDTPKLLLDVFVQGFEYLYSSLYVGSVESVISVEDWPIDCLVELVLQFSHFPSLNESFTYFLIHGGVLMAKKSKFFVALGLLTWTKRLRATCCHDDDVASLKFGLSSRSMNAAHPCYYYIQRE